jgi:hypothetical protein
VTDLFFFALALCNAGLVWLAVDVWRGCDELARKVGAVALALFGITGVWGCLAVATADARPLTGAHARWCTTERCARRAFRPIRRHRRIIRHWRRVAAPHAAWLESTSWCESGSSGHYKLRTTTGLYWFALQFSVNAWHSPLLGGGRVDRNGDPIGRWGGRVPRRAEQNYRAVRVLRVQGPGAWPVCG